jgi:hypothetical protein
VLTWAFAVFERWPPWSGDGSGWFAPPGFAGVPGRWWQCGAVPDEELLRGGIANAGLVRRVGDTVLRPANENSATIHALLRHVRRAGFDGVPEPLDLDSDGDERLRYIPGDVPCPPFPPWWQTDAALASTVTLLRRFHDATVGFVAPVGATWSQEMADPEGGDVVCHNDVCPENVVFRDGVAVALLDFDFAAPGTRMFDLARLALMTVPIDTPEDAARAGRGALDPFSRLRVAADAYGLPPHRVALIDAIERNVARGVGFLQRRIDRGEEAFITMVEQMGGLERYERRRAWFSAHRDRLLEAVG